MAFLFFFLFWLDARLWPSVNPKTSVPVSSPGAILCVVFLLWPLVSFFRLGFEQTVAGFFCLATSSTLCFFLLVVCVWCCCCFFCYVVYVTSRYTRTGCSSRRRRQNPPRKANKQNGHERERENPETPLPTSYSYYSFNFRTPQSLRGSPQERPVTFLVLVQPLMSGNRLELPSYLVHN